MKSFILNGVIVLTEFTSDFIALICASSWAWLYDNSHTRIARKVYKGYAKMLLVSGLLQCSLTVFKDSFKIWLPTQTLL